MADWPLLGPRYDPSDFDFYLVGEDASEGVKPVDVSGLTFDIKAEPPAAAFDQLCVTAPRFVATWDRQRGDLPSASEYELSLADQAAAAGWEPQAILNLVIAWRRRHGEKPEKALRADIAAQFLSKAAKHREESESSPVVHVYRSSRNGAQPVSPVSSAASRPETGDTGLETGSETGPETGSETGETGSESPYTIHWAREAWEPQPPIAWIVEPLFSAGSVSLIVGAPGSKKTYACIDLAVAVALGQPWLGFKVTHGTVLIIDEESGHRRMNRRLAEAMRAHDAPDETPIAYTTLEGFNFRNSRHIELIIRLIEEVGPSVVIIDALADIAPGADENAVKDMLPVMLTLRQVADRLQVAIIAIHHVNKTGRYRGSSAIQGAVDLMIAVESEPKSPKMDFITVKARDIEPIAFSATFDYDRDEESFKLLSADHTSRTFDEKLGASQKYVLHFLLQNGSSTVREVMDGADVCSPNAARQALYRLAESGRIRRCDSGGNGSTAVYELMPGGIQ